MRRYTGRGRITPGLVPNANSLIAWYETIAKARQNLVETEEPVTLNEAIVRLEATDADDRLKEAMRILMNGIAQAREHVIVCQVALQAVESLATGVVDAASNGKLKQAVQIQKRVERQLDESIGAKEEDAVLEAKTQHDSEREALYGSAPESGLPAQHERSMLTAQHMTGATKRHAMQEQLAQQIKEHQEEEAKQPEIPQAADTPTEEEKLARVAEFADNVTRTKQGRKGLVEVEY